MGENTAIEWADDTANFWEGCTQISPGCDNCYAMMLARRFGSVEWNGPPRKVKAGLAVVRKAQRFALASGTPRFVFVNSISDFFDNQADPAWRLEALDAMRAAPNCIFLVLTKRIGNVERMMQETGISWKRHLQHVWLGISVVNQPEADRDIPKLLAAKAPLGISRVFLSVEPMLGPVKLDNLVTPEGFSIDALAGKGWASPFHRHPQPIRFAGIDWVICGGESGAKARPMHPDWVRSLRDQCAAADVPFFFKQWGEHAIIYDRDVDDPDWRRCDVVHREHPRGQWLNIKGGQGFHGERVVYAERVGKHAAGRLLDGAEHNARPAPTVSTGQKGEALATRLTSPGSPE